MVLFGSLVPANDFRARLVLLLQRPGDLTLHGLLWGVLMVLSILALSVARPLSMRSVAGAAVAAALALGLIASGALNWFPEVPSVSIRWLITIVSTLAVAVRIFQLRGPRGEGG